MEAKAGLLLTGISAVSSKIGLDLFGVADANIQDQYFPIELESSERIVVVVVPEVAAVGGGVLSLFSITRELRVQQKLHGFNVVSVTRPQKRTLRRTYFRHKGFKNSEHVFRFEQLQRCKNVKKLILLIPEYAVSTFATDLSNDEKRYLGDIPFVRINILNQNIELMPEISVIDDLRKLVPNLTQSVAHHANARQDIADRFRLPTLLLPAYTDLSQYAPYNFAEKRNLIVYSPDSAPHKTACLEKIRSSLPQYELREIRDITFEDYVELARSCKFSISFGEGFDGYFSQPMQLGGIGFAVYSPHFFPSSKVDDRYNVFSNRDQMVDLIVERINILSSDGRRYAEINKQWVDDINALYNLADYRSRIGRLMCEEFDFTPITV